MYQVAKDINPKEQELIDKYMPGSLTVIFDKREDVPEVLTGGLETVGIRIPNVPQEVPVANARTQATTKMTAGRKFASPAAPDIRSPTKYFAPSTVVIFLRPVAKVRIRIAGTIAMKP